MVGCRFFFESSCAPAVAASCCCVVLLLSIGTYSATLYDKFTPVYQDIDCGDEVITLQGISASGFNLQVGLNVALTCSNPNPYKITIVEPKEGKVYHADTMEEIGVIKAQTGKLPQGAGKVTLNGQVRLGGFGALSMIGRILNGPVHIFLDISFKCVIVENLLVASLTVSPAFEQKCGVTLDVSGGQAGGITCAESFDDLNVTDIGIVLKSGSSSMGVSQAALEDATKSKDSYLGATMGISFSVVALLLVCQVYTVFQMWRASSYSQTMQVGMEATRVGNNGP